MGRHTRAVVKVVIVEGIGAAEVGGRGVTVAVDDVILEDIA